MKAQNGLARILKAEGVRWLGTFPVSSVNSACVEEGIGLIMMRDERFAVAIADGYSRVSNGQQIGVCTVMGGLNAAGIQMAYPAIAQAFEDSSPLLCITEGAPLGGSGTSAYDITRAFESVTKWTGYIDQPHRVPEFMRRAFTYLRTGKPGPVLIQIPRNLGEYDEAAYPYEPVKGWKSMADPDDVKAAVRALLAAKKPLLYIGQGVFYADACAELLRFAKLVQAPVLTTLKAKSAFPEDHPLSIGMRGEPATHFLQNCDLLFAIGSSLSPGRFSHHIPEAAKKVIIQCTVDESDINRSYRVHHALVGDAKLVLNQLCEEVTAQTGGGVKPKQALLDEIKATKAKLMAKYLPPLTSNEKPINPYRVYWDLMHTIDRRNSFVTADSGNTRDQLSTVYEALIPHGFLGWGNVSTLGFGLGAAIGAKLRFPDRTVVHVTGDAGVGYQLGNYESLVRNNIGITTIHINNGGFAGYGPGFWGPGHDPYTYAVSPPSVANLAKAVASFGEYSERIEEPGDIIPALERAFEENRHHRPAYLEILCCQYPVYGEWVHD